MKNTLKPSRKNIILALSLCLCLSSLVGCGSKDEPMESSAPTVVQSMEPSPSAILFSELDTETMSNYMNAGRFAESGSWVYGLWFSPESGKGNLSKIKIDRTEQSVIDDYPALYINIVDGWVYYVSTDGSSSDLFNCVKKARISGEDAKVISRTPDEESYLSYMFIYKDQIYYSILNEDDGSSLPTGQLYSCDLNGENTRIVLDKAVYFPYIINEQLYYQDDNDGCRIHRCSLDGTNDVVFIDHWVYSYIFDGESFYYATYEDKNLDADTIRANNTLKRVIRKCDPFGLHEEDAITSDCTEVFAMTQNTIFYVNEDANNKIYSFNLKDGSIDVVSEDENIAFITILGNKLCYTKMSSDYSSVDDIWLIDLQGTNKQSLFSWED